MPSSIRNNLSNFNHFENHLNVSNGNFQYDYQDRQEDPDDEENDDYQLQKYKNEL